MKRFGYYLTVAVLILGMVMTSCIMVMTSCQKDTRTYYTVTFDANGGSFTGETVISVAEGKLVPTPSFTRHPGRYGLAGWYTEAELIHAWDFKTDVITDDMTLYAGWSPLYSVTFYANGGTFPNHEESETWTFDQFREGETIHYGAGLNNPLNVIKAGYVLEGWYRDAELTEPWDFGADVVTGDGALYAKWYAGIEGLTIENYPRVDGATSTRALNMMIACKLLGLPYSWSIMPETDEATVWPVGDNKHLDRSIATSQTYGAMMNLIEGRADIILRSTTASPDEKAAALAASVELIETPIALDAFVFLRNPFNPVKSLTIEQIRKIYTKQITNWSEVGGNKAAMKVFTRQRNSGSEEALRELVMGGLEPAEFPAEQQLHSMTGVFWEMERTNYGIAYIFKNYKERIMMRFAEYEPTFAIEGILPDATTIGNRSYPLTTEVYAIIRSDLDRGSMAFKLYEWLQTGSAEVVLAECGFVLL